MRITLYSRDSLIGDPVNIDGVVFRAVWNGTENDLPVALEDFADADEAAFIFADDELQIGDVVKLDDRHYVKTPAQWVKIKKSQN